MSSSSKPRSSRSRNSAPESAISAPRLPLVVYLNCVEDCSAEQRELQGVAQVEHVALTDIGKGQIEAAAVVVVHSLAFLPRNAQRRLSPVQLILCLGSSDKQVDSSLATELGLRLFHIDRPRADEVADSAMALMLVLLRRTHDLATQRCGRISWAPGYTSLRGMKRLKGKVIGLVGTDKSAVALAQRARGFKMKVIFLDLQQDDDFGRAQAGLAKLQREGTEVARLEELLAQSDVVSLHCPLTQETVKMLDDQAFRSIKKGALVINTSSSHLVDDSALKRALISGAVGGAALDGVEGPEWLEAWVREMPNVLITPRSCEYSDEVWAEVRVKASGAVRKYVAHGIVPSERLASDDDVEEQSGDVDSAGRDVGVAGMESPAGEDSAQAPGGRRRRSSRRHRGGRGQAQTGPLAGNGDVAPGKPGAVGSHFEWQAVSPRPEGGELPLESPASVARPPSSFDPSLSVENIVATEQQASALPQPEHGQQPIQLGLAPSAVSGGSASKSLLVTFSSGDSLGSAEDRRSSGGSDVTATGGQAGGSGRRRNRRKSRGGKKGSQSSGSNLPTVHSGTDIGVADILPPGVEPPPFVTGPPFQPPSVVRRTSSSDQWFAFQGGPAAAGNGPPSAGGGRTGLGKRKSGGGNVAAPAEDLAAAVGGLNLGPEHPPTSSYPADRTFVGLRSSSRDGASNVTAPAPPVGYDGKGILGEGPGDPSGRRPSLGGEAPGFEMGGSLNGSLEDGLMVAFKAKDKGQYWVATERRGWALELGAPGVDASDPAAQFLVVMRGKDRLGFRSLVADGKLLQVRERTSKGHPQATRKLELMFVNFSLDTLENWLITGTSLADCVISSKKFPEVSLALSLEVLAVPPEEEDVLLDDMAGSVQKPEASPDAEEESLV